MTKTGNISERTSPCEFCGRQSVVVRLGIPMCESHASSVAFDNPGSKINEIQKVASLLETAPTTTD